MTRALAPHRAEAWLLRPTSAEWAVLAADGIDETLVDHAHCEKKAAVSAIALINDYPGDAPLVSALGRLAAEELGHFREVFGRLEQRGVPLGRDTGDPYARALLALVRRPNDERKLDRLLVCALIEARSCERFRLLGAELARRGENELAAWFARLEASEAGHAALFMRLAEERFGHLATARAAELAQAEADIVDGLPREPRIH